MDKSHANLFQVYLRLRPALSQANAERFLLVEEAEEDDAPTYITLNPPNDRRRAIEKFAFTQVFEEDASQLDLFQGTRVLPLVEQALAPHGGTGTDGLLATLGVTGSGKTHTILGSPSQRGLTQMALDVIFRSIESNMADPEKLQSLEASIQASDASEATIYSAPAFLETIYSDYPGTSRGSRAGTPLTVRPPKENPKENAFICPSMQSMCPQLPSIFPDSPNSMRLVRHEDDLSQITLLSTPPNERFRSIPRSSQVPGVPDRPKLANPSASKKHYMAPTSAAKSKTVTKSPLKGSQYGAPSDPRPRLQRPSALPVTPDISSIRASCDPSAEYAIVMSMYEVYNDRIFDLLTPPMKMNATKEYRRRPLLFKSTEQSPDRKLVAGLRKIICSNLKEALMVLEAGLHERRVAGTGSNSVSSRSHGFICVEIKKRRRGRSNGSWGGSTLSIVDLAGSERARDAKTQGTTLAEAGKINESLMYLGQCLQMQSDTGNANKSTIQRRAPQKFVMIVTADPLGDFNATSQILRYSALAREVTVPRIPSITSTILSTAPSFHQPSSYTDNSSPLSSPVSHHRPYFIPSGTHQRLFSPVSESDRATMENAALEIARMAEEIDTLTADLARETEARTAAEAHLLSMEDRIQDLEQEIREECYTDFERRLAMEMARYKSSLLLELERGEEHWDRKVELLARGVGVVVTSPSDEENDENDDKENVLIENLEQENERLRREVAVLKRELGSRTPSKRLPLHERGDIVVGVRSEMEGLGTKMEGLRVSSSSKRGENEKPSSRVTSTGSPTKKVRKLGTKKWDVLDTED